MTPVDPSNIHAIANILANCTELVENKLKFSLGVLGITPAEELELNQKNLSRNGGNFGYFSAALGKWAEQKGRSLATIENLAAILMDNRFTSASENVTDFLQSGQAAGPSPIQSPSPGAVPTYTASPEAKIQVSMKLFNEQKKFVTGKLNELIPLTRNWDALVTELQTESLLSEPVIQTLIGKPNNTDRFRAMYIEVMSRKTFFETLKKCMENSDNEDVVEILNEFRAFSLKN